ncbi:SsrA-binding protein SmpB [bacterium]|nr:SsrA-binding protein SmpB [bacterium]
MENLITVNKRAYHNFEILETKEAGIVLTGPEVKSVKQGQINISNGFVSLDKNLNCWLNNVHISPYKPAALGPEYDPLKPRKLLLKKKEIKELIGKIQVKGLTIIPLKVYSKRNLIKVEIGIAKGKKQKDKREEIKKREIERKIQQRLKQF